MTDTLQTTGISRTGAYVRVIRWGLVALAASAAIAWYGAYGDPHPQADQEAAVPAIIAVMAGLIVVLFGALVAPGLRGASTHPARWAGIGLTLGILGLVAVPVSSWSGLPLVLGTAAALLGGATRSRSRRLSGWTLGVGAAAIVLSVVMVVVGNTVLSS
jgi:hypothetical protein